MDKISSRRAESVFEGLRKQYLARNIRRKTHSLESLSNDVFTVAVGASRVDEINAMVQSRMKESNGFLCVRLSVLGIASETIVQANLCCSKRNF